MKKSTSELFDLIKSLTKTEKGYFKKYCKAFISEKETEYLLLFDFIDKMSNYDEELIKAKFKGTSVEKHFPAKKNYLQNVIYKVLNQYHSSLSIDIELRNQLNISEILAAKGLKKQSLALLHRSEKIACKYEKDLYHLEIFDKKVRNAILSTDVKEIESYKEIYNQFQESTINRYSKKISLRSVYLNIVYDYQKYGSGKFHQEKANEYEKKLLLIKNDNSSDIEKIFWLQAVALLYQNTDNIEKQIEVREEQIKVFTKNKSLVYSESINYLSCLSDLAQLYKANARYEDALNTLIKLKEEIGSIPLTNTNYYQGIYKMFYCQILLNLYQIAGLYNDAIVLIKNIDSLLESYRGLIRYEFEIVLQLQFASIYAVASKFEEAQICLHKILNENKEIRKDLLVSSSLLSAIIHNEQGNNYYAHYILSHTAKKYKNSEMKTRFFSDFLITLDKFLLEISSGSGKKKSKDNVGWEKIINLLNSIENDDTKSHVLRGFDYVSWAESKKYNKNVASIIQEKNKKLVVILNKYNTKLKNLF